VVEKPAADAEKKVVWRPTSLPPGIRHRREVCVTHDDVAHAVSPIAAVAVGSFRAMLNPRIVMLVSPLIGPLNWNSCVSDGASYVKRDNEVPICECKSKLATNAAPAAGCMCAHAVLVSEVQE